MVITVPVNADYERDLSHQLHDKVKKKFTKGENRDFSAFQFSLQLMLEQALTNLIVCLMILQKLHTKAAQMS